MALYLAIGMIWAQSIRDWFVDDREWKTAYPFAALFWGPVLFGRIALWVYWTVEAAVRRMLR